MPIAPHGGGELGDLRVSDSERAELLVRICLAVAEVGGEKKLVDQIEIVILCSLLGIEPRYAGLYTADGSGLLDQPES